MKMLTTTPDPEHDPDRCTQKEIIIPHNTANPCQTDRPIHLTCQWGMAPSGKMQVPEHRPQ